MNLKNEIQEEIEYQCNIIEATYETLDKHTDFYTIIPLPNPDTNKVVDKLEVAEMYSLTASEDTKTITKEGFMKFAPSVLAGGIFEKCQSTSGSEDILFVRVGFESIIDEKSDMVFLKLKAEFNTSDN